MFFCSQPVFWCLARMCKRAMCVFCVDTDCSNVSTSENNHRVQAPVGGFILKSRPDATRTAAGLTPADPGTGPGEERLLGWT